MKQSLFALVLGAVIGAGGLTFAQSPMTHGAMDHSAVGHAAMGHGAVGNNPVISAFQAVNDRMHREMAIAFTGEADVDFVRGMIPHHQGAIDIARVVLEHGWDAEIRALAEEVTEAQDAEVTMMRAWLAARLPN
jgi:uncharacterized protein (DUF305 family)